MNNFYGIGRLTKDVTVNYTPSQMAVARFNIAIDRGKDRNGESRGADFPSCVAFGKTAENLEKFSGKGLRIAIIGHIQTGSYDKDGTSGEFYTRGAGDLDISSTLVGLYYNKYFSRFYFIISIIKIC